MTRFLTLLRMFYIIGYDDQWFCMSINFTICSYFIVCFRFLLINNFTVYGFRCFVNYDLDVTSKVLVTCLALLSYSALCFADAASASRWLVKMPVVPQKLRTYAMLVSFWKYFYYGCGHSLPQSTHIFSSEVFII